jgi:uncharacterized protein (TIGR02996 family)
MMHPEADALLDAIFAEPDDDTPRLVYADWLEEHSQSNYAQFMRLQCAAARHKFWTPEANDLWEQIGRVWTRLSDEWWEATTPGFVNGTDLGDRWDISGLDAVHFDRGLPRSSIWFDYLHLWRLGTTCWPWLPFPVTSLRMDSPPPAGLEWKRLLRVRHLRIKIPRNPHGDTVWPLFSSPFLRNVEVLEFYRGHVTVDGFLSEVTPVKCPLLRHVRIRIYDELAAQNWAEGNPAFLSGPGSRAEVLERLRLHMPNVAFTVESDWL